MTHKVYSAGWFYAEEPIPQIVKEIIPHGKTILISLDGRYGYPVYSDGGSSVQMLADIPTLEATKERLAKIRGRVEKFVGWLTTGNIRAELYRIQDPGCARFYMLAEVPHASPLGVALDTPSEKPPRLIEDGLAFSYMNTMEFCSGRSSKLVAMEKERIAADSDTLRAQPITLKQNEFPAPCGCIVRFDNDGIARLSYCDMHNAAPDLFQACAFALEYLNSPPFIALHGDRPAREAQTAIDKAAPRKLTIACPFCHEQTGKAHVDGTARCEHCQEFFQLPEESTEPRPELSFDGRGINGPDEYRTRIATFNHPENADADAKKYGPLFAAAPDLLAACQLWQSAERNGGVSMADIRTKATQAINAAVAKAVQS